MDFSKNNRSIEKESKRNLMNLDQIYSIRIEWKFYNFLNEFSEIEPSRAPHTAIQKISIIHGVIILDLRSTRFVFFFFNSKWFNASSYIFHWNFLLLLFIFPDPILCKVDLKFFMLYGARVSMLLFLFLNKRSPWM